MAPPSHHSTYPSSSYQTKESCDSYFIFLLAKIRHKTTPPKQFKKKQIDGNHYPSQLYLYKVTDFLNEYKCGYKRHILVAVKTTFASTPATLFGLDP